MPWGRATGPVPERLGRVRPITGGCEGCALHKGATMKGEREPSPVYMLSAQPCI